MILGIYGIVNEEDAMDLFASLNASLFLEER